MKELLEKINEELSDSDKMRIRETYKRLQVALDDLNRMLPGDMIKLLAAVRIEAKKLMDELSKRKIW